MSSFSERYGYSPVRTVVQREAIDSELRVALWNLMELAYFDALRSAQTMRYSGHEEVRWARRVWMFYFKQPLDNMPRDWATYLALLRKEVFDNEWFLVYDLLEHMPEIEPTTAASFMRTCNDLLARHLAAYRFVDGRIVEITSNEEIVEIEQALSETHSMGSAAATHLREALDLLGDRANPNYRNSIKESISAVESIASAIVGKKATLGDALKRLADAGVELHPALKDAFGKLYGWTSDADGIRHALTSESTATQDEARFMLVACSAFVNYLIVKASAPGVIAGDHPS